VQDRYAGDLGDYLKLGLLRWLTSSEAVSGPRLGVVWYRTVDDVHNADGKHIAYLSDDDPSARRMRPLDPDLYDRLAAVVATGRRSTSALADAGVLPADTVYFDEVLDLQKLPIAARAARTELRQAWLDRALTATSGCDLIFADPDNGVRSRLHPVGFHTNRSLKHVYLNELASFADRGQSLVVYHHADRSAPVEQQAQLRLTDLASENAMEPIAAVRASRGTTRLFLVAAKAASTGDYLKKRLEDLIESSWRGELKVYGQADSTPEDPCTGTKLPQTAGSGTHTERRVRTRHFDREVCTAGDLCVTGFVTPTNVRRVRHARTAARRQAE
jgi:hypothetical protein